MGNRPAIEAGDQPCTQLLADHRAQPRRTLHGEQLGPLPPRTRRLVCGRGPIPLTAAVPSDLADDHRRIPTEPKADLLVLQGLGQSRGRSPRDQSTSTSCARCILSHRLGKIKCYDRLSPRASGNQAFAVSCGSPGTPPRTPGHELPVSWHAVFPGYPFGTGSAIRSRDISSRPCPLRGQYSSAPHGAPTTTSSSMSRSRSPRPRRATPLCGRGATRSRYGGPTCTPFQGSPSRVRPRRYRPRPMRRSSC